MRLLQFLRTLLVLGFGVLLLSGCGFHLRGVEKLPFGTLYLGMDEQSGMGAMLKRRVLASGAQVVGTPSEAEAALAVLADKKTKSILSLNASGRVREFLLQQEFSFKLTDRNGHLLVAPTTLKVTRDISYSDRDLLAKDAEEAMLYRDMQSDLTQQVMRRLAAARAN